MAELMQIIDASRNTSPQLEALRSRSLADLPPDLEEATREIVNRVREYGDEALVDYTRRFDCPGFSADRLLVSPEEIQDAYSRVPLEWMGAFRRARENVLRYHEQLIPHSWLQDFDGLFLGQRVRPLASVGAYVPGGTAPLPSTVCMTVMPAKAAGVGRIAVATPPGRDGDVSPYIAVAAAECGVHELYRMGGAQAVAALAFGTETVEPVDKIVGPGNPYVILAKKQVFGRVGIEALPGPSEAVIIADDTVPASLAAADLLSQAEHTGDNTVILITDSEDFAYEVRDEAYQQVEQLPRQELTAQSLADYGAIVVMSDLAAAAELSNQIAPEHLQLLVSEPLALLEQIENAGCICLGALTPVPLGDYAAGPSHVLPTNGTARFSSALSTDDFLKKSSLIYATPRGLQRLGTDVCRLAQAEGLEAHARSVQLRLDTEQEGGK
jgi:histidinol dehydrogenase